jgi:hypothetical protein
MFLRLVALGLGPEVTAGSLALFAQLPGPPRLHLCLSVSDLLNRHAIDGSAPARKSRDPFTFADSFPARQNVGREVPS